MVSSMQAWVTDDAETISLRSVPVPRIDDTELLVQVRAVGVGIHDSYFLPPGITYPFPVGIEAAGVVEDIGGAVTGHRPGDRITFVSAMQPKGGTWAEYAAVSSDALLLTVPASMSLTTAAAAPVAGNTVLKVMAALTIPSEGWLFIAGGSGAIGTLAIQLARRQGWRVVASASRENHDYMRALGATHVVDYHDADWIRQVRDAVPGGTDAAVAVNPGTTADSMQAVRDGGQVITVSADRTTPERGVQVEMPSHQLDVGAAMQQLLEDIAQGTIALVIEEIYPFAQGAAALHKVQSRHARGKTVLTLAPDGPTAR